MISRIRHGSSPAFQNVCHWLRGLNTRSPGPASTTSSPSSAPMRPSSTKLYSSSRVCRWSGAASARGDIGCSTSEKRSPASNPSIMKRTPMRPEEALLRRLPGSTIFGAVAVACMSRLLFIGQWCRAKIYDGRPHLSILRRHVCLIKNAPTG